MTHPTANIDQQLQAIESQLEALTSEKEQLLEAQVTQAKERLEGFAGKVKVACNNDETLLAQVLAHMGYEPTSRKRRADLERRLKTSS
ncbi:MAG: hypothetical protein AAFW75_25905 [Cyanobacteria bacterium J06636_16]